MDQKPQSLAAQMKGLTPEMLARIAAQKKEQELIEFRRSLVVAVAPMAVANCTDQKGTINLKAAASVAWDIADAFIEIGAHKDRVRREVQEATLREAAAAALKTQQPEPPKVS